MLQKRLEMLKKSGHFVVPELNSKAGLYFYCPSLMVALVAVAVGNKIFFAAPMATFVCLGIEACSNLNCMMYVVLLSADSLSPRYAVFLSH